MDAKHKAEELKGRAKEAAGSLRDDAELRREGQADQGRAHVKGAAREVADKVAEGAERVKRAAEGDR